MWFDPCRHKVVDETHQQFRAGNCSDVAVDTLELLPDVPWTSSDKHHCSLQAVAFDLVQVCVGKAACLVPAQDPCVVAEDKVCDLDIEKDRSEVADALHSCHSYMDGLALCRLTDHIEALVVAAAVAAWPYLEVVNSC